MKRLAFCLLFAAFPLQAQDLQPWGQVAGWDVMIDPGLGNGCLIMADFQDGSTVRIGLDPSTGEGYVMAFNQAWGDVEDGMEYAITYDVDGQTYEGSAFGTHLDGLPGVDVPFGNFDFLVDIALKHTLTLAHEGQKVMAIDLTGTHAALQEVVTCQQAQG